MKKFLVFLAAISLLLFSFATASAYIFEDNFDSENSGNYALKYVGFANWAVTGGTVDLIGLGSPWDFFPENGLFVDLDGSTDEAGKLVSSPNFLLAPGTYELSFDLAGNQRDGMLDFTNTYAKIFESGSTPALLFNYFNTLGRDDPFTTYSYIFTIDDHPTEVRLAFQAVGPGADDNIGMLLDNVRLASVPEPATMLLLGTGLFGLAAVGRKKFFKKG